MIFLFHYLPWKLINVLASFQKNPEPMMTVEYRSVRPGFQRADLSRMKRRFYRGSPETAKGFKLDMA